MTLPGEEVYVGTNKAGKLLVVSEPKINSKNDLEEYVKRAHRRRSIAIEKGEKTIAVVTAQKLLPFKRIKELESKYSLRIIGVKIRSSNGGTVFSRWPPDLEWLDSLQNTLSRELEKREGIKDFKLVQGVIALYVVREARVFNELQDEIDVFLVDVGPVDIASQYKGDKEVIIRVSDLFYYLEKLEIY